MSISGQAKISDDGLISRDAIRNTVGFGGYLYDPAVEMYLSRHRWYAPDQGRWMNTDPLGYVDGMNTFEYVRSSPISFSDPFGLETRTKWTEEKAKKALCSALADAKEQGMDLRDFVRKYSPTDGSDPFHLRNLEFDTDEYGNVDIDWMLTIIHVYYDGIHGVRYWIDPLRGADPSYIYLVGKNVWIVADAISDPNVDVDFGRYGQDNEKAAIEAARDLINNKMTLEGFFNLQCECDDSNGTSDDSVDKRRRDRQRGRRGR